jgi:uncharacterized membrane protein
MYTEVNYENLPEGYIKKRKNASLALIFSIYAFCIFSLISHFNMFSINQKAPMGLIVYAFYIGTIFFLVRDFVTKRNYNGIPMKNHSDIKVFSRLEIILYSIPVILMTPFIIVNLLRYGILVGFTYFAISSFYRPYDDYEKYRRFK